MYKFPDPICFENEENCLRTKNMKQLQDFLNNLVKFLEMVEELSKINILKNLHK